MALLNYIHLLGNSVMVAQVDDCEQKHSTESWTTTSALRFIKMIIMLLYLFCIWSWQQSLNGISDHLQVVWHRDIFIHAVSFTVIGKNKLTPNYNSCNIDKVYPSEPSNPLRNVLLSLATNNLSRIFFSFLFFFPMTADERNKV